MLKASLLIQTGVFGLVIAGIIFLLRMVEDVSEVLALQSFLRSGYGLGLMIGLTVYGLFGIFYGGYKLYLVFKNE